jgi:Flp pilus assembly protein CpaB
MATVAQQLTSIRGFRPARRVNGRIVVASSLAVLSVLALLVGLSAVVPETQSVLQATRDLPAGTVVQASDIAAVHVRVPDNMARIAYLGSSSDQLVGHRVAVHVSAGEMLTSAQFATEHVSVAPGRVQMTIPVESYTASAGALGPGDTVVVYASPRQATAIDAATPLVPSARVVAVVAPIKPAWVPAQAPAPGCSG